MKDWKSGALLGLDHGIDHPSGLGARAKYRSGGG